MILCVTEDDVLKLYRNITPFGIRDLRVCRIWLYWGTPC